MADQGHPTFDATAGWVPLDDRSLPVEHLVGRRGIRAVVDVPPPHAERRPEAGDVERTGDGIAVGDRTGLDDGGDPVGECLDGRDGGRDLVVSGFVRGVQRHGPVEDRGARRKEVGDATPHQRITGEVLVGIDHARGDHATCDVDDVGRRMGRNER